MNDEAVPTTGFRPLRWILALLLAALVVAAAVWGWRQWIATQAREQQQAQADEVRLQGLLESVQALRRDQRATSQRLQDAATSNRVLRDEVLGLGQRSALLGENLARLADRTRAHSDVLHRDEAELLLAQAGQRLQGAGDVEGARRLYALAAAALADLGSEEALNLRQALIQERNALDALGEGPRALALRRLGAFTRALETLPLQVQAGSPPAAAQRPWWQLVLAPFVEITPSQLNGPLSEAERVAGRDALQVELTLARAAIERGDTTSLGLALDQVERWMSELWPDSPALRDQRAELQALRTAPLRPDAPELGSTLQQLRTLQDGGSP